MILAKSWTCVVVILAGASTSLASLSVPNGNPTGAASRTGQDGGIVRLTPAQAVYMPRGSCPWLPIGLTAQGFSTDNNWTINYGTLSGNIQLDHYYAYADTEPAVTYGPWTDAAVDVRGWGGAVLGLKYNPGVGDPTGAGVRQIQVIRTNDPSAFGRNNGVRDAVDPNFWIYIDNGWQSGVGARVDPFYGKDDNLSNTGYWGNSQYFYDAPRREMITPGYRWEAQVFIATGDLANKRLNIYDGVWWGFQTVPTPGALATFGLGVVLTLKRRR